MLIKMKTRIYATPAVKGLTYFYSRLRDTVNRGLTFATLNIFVQTTVTKGFLQCEIIINISVSSFCFI